MKTKFLFTMCLLLSLIVQAKGSDAIQNESEKNKIRVGATTQVKNLAESFILQYVKENPGVKFELNELSGSNLDGELQPGTVAIFAENEMGAAGVNAYNNITNCHDYWLDKNIQESTTITRKTITGRKKKEE